MNRTDLALEAHQHLHPGAGAMDGVEITKEQAGQIEVTCVWVKTALAAQQLEKPVGHYITLEFASVLRKSPATPQQAGRVLGEYLARLPAVQKGPVLVVVGNAAITPDAVGPRTLQHLLVTRHLRRYAPELFTPLTDCSAFAPDVLAATGMESAEMVRGMVSVCKAQCMLVIDALAASEEKRLCTTVQLADSGIVPGSGIGNARAAFNRETMGIPVIALGVPTVISTSVLCGKPTSGDWIVTPSDIDVRVARITRILAAGINRALFPHLSETEIAKLVAE